VGKVCSPLRKRTSPEEKDVRCSGDLEISFPQRLESRRIPKGKGKKNKEARRPPPGGREGHADPKRRNIIEGKKKVH